MIDSVLLALRLDGGAPLRVAPQAWGARDLGVGRWKGVGVGVRVREDAQIEVIRQRQ